jgi:hypothetical protein
MLALIAPTAYAQTGTANSNLAWDQSNVATAAEAQAFTYRYYPDGSALGIVLANVACTGITPVICTVAFPAFTPGAHTLRLTASNVAGESAPSTVLAFTFVVVPTAPSNPRIQ